MTRSTLARSLWCALVVIPLLPVVAVANDNCADAFVAIIDTYTGDTITATNDGVADCGISDTSPDVWYEFTAAEDGVLTVASCGSDYDTVLSLHSACPGTIANQLVCNDDSCGLQSSVTTAVITGDVIYIRSAGFADATGDYTIVLTGPAGVPAGGSPPGTEFMRGDINVDGVFDISDPVYTLGALFTPGSPQPSAPFPNCGIDPTADSLNCASFNPCP